MHNAESPANKRLRPVASAELNVVCTLKVALTYPSSGRKKICTPRLACTSVRLVGSDGLSSAVPEAVEVKMPFSSLTSTDEVMSLPEVGRSGVLTYAYLSPTTSCSVYSPLGPLSKSYTDIPINAVEGRISVVEAEAQVYACRRSSRFDAVHSLLSVTSALKQQQPAA